MTDNDAIVKNAARRIRALLNLARDGGASEGEASNAMERARALMAKHGLTMATVVAGGGVGEARMKETMRDAASQNQKWQLPLMEAIAETNFVFVAVAVERRRVGEESEERSGHVREFRVGYELIGRESAVAATRVMFEYLVQTTERLARERGAELAAQMPDIPPMRARTYFKRGMSERIVERLLDKHRDYLQQQKAEAEQAQRESDARASHPSAAPSGQDLVVVMQDFARQEEDLNEDMRRGLEPGTTERYRLEDERNRLEREERLALRLEELRREYPDEDEDVTWYMAQYGYTLESARDLCERSEKEREARKPESESTRRRRREKEEREYDKWHEREKKEMRKRNSPAWRAGRSNADAVGLDQQIGHQETRRIR